MKDCPMWQDTEWNNYATVLAENPHFLYLLSIGAELKLNSQVLCCSATSYAISISNWRMFSMQRYLSENCLLWFYEMCLDLKLVTIFWSLSGWICSEPITVHSAVAPVRVADTTAHASLQDEDNKQRMILNAVVLLFLQDLKWLASMHMWPVRCFSQTRTCASWWNMLLGVTCTGSFQSISACLKSVDGGCGAASDSWISEPDHCAVTWHLSKIYVFYSPAKGAITILVLFGFFSLGHTDFTSFVLFHLFLFHMLF